MHQELLFVMAMTLHLQFGGLLTLIFMAQIYTTADDISVSSNGFIRLDGTATNNYITARNYNLTSTATSLGEIIAIALYDGDPRYGYIKYLTTGSAPYRVLTIEFYKYEIDYNDRKFCYAQASFYENIQ